MPELKTDRIWTMAALLAAALMVIAFTGCNLAPGRYLDRQQVDRAAILKNTEKMNAISFETFGPTSDQRLGYLLFREGTRVDMGGAVYVNLGKMTTGEVVTHHERSLRSRMYTGTPLDIREYRRGDGVIAYTLVEYQVDVSLWDETAADGRPAIRLNYDDRRSFSGSGDGSDKGNAGQ